MEWEKIFTSHIPDKGLLSRLCKEFLQLNNHTHTQNPKHPDSEGAMDLSRCFSKEDIQMASKHMNGA